MILHINTTEGDEIEIVLRSDDNVVARKKVSARFAQAEKLLPLVDKVLRSNKTGLKDIEGIRVNNEGGSFTALRIGVVTANALGYALGAPVKSESGIGDSESGRKKFSVVRPMYDKEPNITVKGNA